MVIEKTSIRYKQVLAQSALSDRIVQVHVGGENDSRVHLNFVGFADTSKTARLDETQKFFLEIEIDIPDFIQKERAFVALFDQSLLFVRRRLKTSPCGARIVHSLPGFG